MSNHTNIITSVIARLAWALALAGCVAQDPGDCPPVEGCRLTFEYTYNQSGQDLIGRVGVIDVYIFDEGTGILSSVVEAGPADIALGRVDVRRLPEGRYTFVAWGGSAAEMSRSFIAAHMIAADRHQHTDIEVGRTTLDEFYMMLGYRGLDEGTAGDIAPATSDFDDLFHALARGVVIGPGGDRTIPFELTRNNNLFRVSVTGLEHIPSPASRASRASRAEATPPEMFVLGRNGRYRYDNSIDPDARLMRYEASNHSLTDSSLSADIGTLRLDLDRHSGEGGDPVLLYLRDGATGIDLMAPLDMAAAIGQIRGSDGGARYPDQAAIDREEEFRINVALGPPADGSKRPVSVSVTINGWRIITLDPETELN